MVTKQHLITTLYSQPHIIFQKEVYKAKRKVSYDGHITVDFILPTVVCRVYIVPLIKGLITPIVYLTSIDKISTLKSIQAKFLHFHTMCTALEKDILQMP